MANTSSKSKVFHQESSVRYRECWRNHAVLIGGYATDGCGEFIPKGDHGTKEALLCEACDCHRNFHRKELVKNGKAVHGSHGNSSPKWWGESNAVGSYTLPSTYSQPPFSSYQQYQYSQQDEVQDTVSDEESAICSGSQGQTEKKERKKSKRKS